MADLPGGCHACHAKLEDGCFGGVGGRGIGLEREAPAAVALAQVEVQDAGLAHAGPACQLHHRPYLVGIGDRDEHPLVKGRRRGLRVGRQCFAVNRHVDRHKRGQEVGPGADSSHAGGVLLLPICLMLGSMANESTGTGVAELDRALDGLYWGDNVVWVWEGSESHQQLFYDAIAQRRDDFGAAGYVAVSSDPAEITARWPWIEILDARASTPITSPRQLLEAIHQFCTRAPRPLLLFDSLAPLADRWGMRIASGFFGHCCPMLLDLGAIAYWSMPGASPYRTMYREIEQITQCILVVGEGRLRISKAEGRPPGAQGQLFRYSVKDGGLQLQPAQAVARVGAALRAYRLRRDLSQSDLARLAGVSPSAISQVERGERGLSLETLM